MKIHYGIDSKKTDVTQICINKLKRNNMIYIPYNDNARVYHFSDPVPNKKKNIYIELNEKNYKFSDNYSIEINLSNLSVLSIDVNKKLEDIHNNITIKYGNIKGELPEQKMAIANIDKNRKVLEIGGNIGRNSLVISNLLENDKNLVVLETDADICKQLEENRNNNKANFFIENSALSISKLIQKGWNTIPSEKLLKGYKWVKVITYEEITKKYNLDFDTLVLDCEGAFYYILNDFPKILDNVNLIIIENDYGSTDNKITKIKRKLKITKGVHKHKQYVDNKLLENNFFRSYVEAGGQGSCKKCFYEVWRK